jgi:hypothetical protein
MQSVNYTTHTGSEKSTPLVVTPHRHCITQHYPTLPYATLSLLHSQLDVFFLLVAQLLLREVLLA